MTNVHIDGARIKLSLYTLFVIFAIVVKADKEIDNRSSETIQVPRVERMHTETSDNCVGTKCLQSQSNSAGPLGGMWFGPRLGRRRRSELDNLDDAVFGSAIAADKKIDQLADFLTIERPAWGVISIPAPPAEKVRDNFYIDEMTNQQRDGIFTPRLGKRLQRFVPAAAAASGAVAPRGFSADRAAMINDDPILDKLNRRVYNERELRRLLRKLQIFV